MKMIKYKDDKSTDYEYFWVNDSEVRMSPSFPKESIALEWYTMHEEWMEEPRPPVFAPEEK
jgi:hypothetical protein